MIYCFNLHFPHYIGVEHIFICLLVTGISSRNFLFMPFVSFTVVVYLCNSDL